MLTNLSLIAGAIVCLGILLSRLKAPADVIGTYLPDTAERRRLLIAAARERQRQMERGEELS